MNPELDRLVVVLKSTYGKDISVHDESLLAKALENRRAATQIQDIAEYLRYLAENSAEADEVGRLLNNTYSEFFRNLLTFALLEYHILPGLVEEKSGHTEIRIWSAGCAAGQEAYSVAILLDELAVTRGQPMSLRIFATDRSERELAAARAGVYEETALQNVRLKHLRRYFTRHGDTYGVIPRLKEHLDFSCHDLLDGASASPAASIYGDFDIVFCSNLLFYYKPDIRQFILSQLYRALSPRGYLVTGEAERAIVEKTTGWRAVLPPAAVYQKK